MSYIKLLIHPKQFFSEDLKDHEWPFASLCLLISSIVFTGMDILTHHYVHIEVVGGILMINAFGMVLISSALGYMIMTMTIGKVVSFGRFYSVYALSSSAALLVLWVPFTFVFIEIWRWWLIGMGLIYGCDLKGRQAFGVIAVSIVVMVGFFVAVRAVLPN